jgi:hypothetical protein
VAAFSSGQYAVGEFGYNPISNNLGLSGAAGTSDPLNVAQGDLAIPTESEWSPSEAPAVHIPAADEPTLLTAKHGPCLNVIAGCS